MTLTVRCASSIAALLLATLSFHASAQIDGYPCNGSPGERQVGVAPPLGTPICVTGAQSSSQVSDQQPDSYTLRANAMLAATKMTAEELKRKMQDPAFQKLSKGYWFYLEPGKGGVSSSTPCTATFAQLSGLFTLMAMGGPDDPIIGTLEGSDIPKPKKQRKIPVTLTSDAQPSISLRMVNAVAANGGMATLTFNAGNNLEQAIGGLHESERNTVEYEGATIFAGGYREGGAMKERFSRCVESRAK